MSPTARRHSANTAALRPSGPRLRFAHKLRLSPGCSLPYMSAEQTAFVAQTSASSIRRACRHGNNGLYKRCDCRSWQWLKCDRGWHFDFYKARKFRYSLDVSTSPRRAAAAYQKRRRDAAILHTARSAPATFTDPQAKPAPKPEPDARLTVGDVIDHCIRRRIKSPTRRERAQKMMLW